MEETKEDYEFLGKVFSTNYHILEGGLMFYQQTLNSVFMNQNHFFQLCLISTSYRVTNTIGHY